MQDVSSPSVAVSRSPHEYNAAAKEHRYLLFQTYLRSFQNQFSIL